MSESQNLHLEARDLKSSLCKEEVIRKITVWGHMPESQNLDLEARGLRMLLASLKQNH